MRDNGAARGGAGRGDAPDFILGRGEMQAAGVSPAELPFFRDWCRTRLNPVYFRMDEPVARAALLIEHVEAYAAELASSSPDRAERLATPMRAAKEAHRLHEAVLRRYQMKKLPTMPDPRTTGSVPTELEDEAPPPNRSGTGEDAWLEDDLPAPRPQGMRVLPAEDVPIPPRPAKGTRMVSDEPKPPISDRGIRKRAERAQARAKLTGPLAPPKPGA